MFKRLLLGAVAAVALTGHAYAGCNDDFDALSKAISGPVTMAEGHRAAMMRMAVSGYDSCMAGDKKNSDGIREMIMMQIRESLGGK
jgi:hypothetical protein